MSDDTGGRPLRTRLLAVALALPGLLAVGAGIAATQGVGLAASLGPVLVAVGAVGVFGGILTWALVGRASVPAATARNVADTTASNVDALLGAFDLTDPPAYVPADGEGRDAVRVLYRAGEGPPPATLDPEVRVLGDSPGTRGVALVPVGAAFLDALARDLPGGLGADPETVAGQVADAAVASVELASRVRVDPETTDGRVVVRARGEQFDSGGRDPAVGSLLASALAASQDRPVVLRRETDGPETVYTCSVVESEE